MQSLRPVLRFGLRGAAGWRTRAVSRRMIEASILSTGPRTFAGQKRHYADFTDTHRVGSKTASGVHGGSLREAIKAGHLELRDLYDKIVKSKDNDEKVRYQNQFTWELARHWVAKELVVYPALEQYVAGGKEMAEEGRTAHQDIQRLLHEFQDLNPVDPKFDSTLGTLWSKLVQEMEVEEEQNLAALEKIVPPDAGEKLVKSFGRTKLFTPTRGHPSLRNLPFGTVAALLAAPVDVLGDLFRKFPDESEAFGKA